MVYAHRTAFREHADALEALRRLADGDEPWALPWFVIAEFLRVVTHPAILRPPTDLSTAIASIEALRTRPEVVVLHAADTTWPGFVDALDAGRAAGDLVFDAQIVATCRDHGVSRLLTEDRDFARFDGIEAVTLCDFLDPGGR